MWECGRQSCNFTGRRTAFLSLFMVLDVEGQSSRMGWHQGWFGVFCL
jgi:hypothetical protein